MNWVRINCSFSFVIAVLYCCVVFYLQYGCVLKNILTEYGTFMKQGKQIMILDSIILIFLFYP